MPIQRNTVHVVCKKEARRNQQDLGRAGCRQGKAGLSASVSRKQYLPGSDRFPVCWDTYVSEAEEKGGGKNRHQPVCFCFVCAHTKMPQKQNREGSGRNWVGGGKTVCAIDRERKERGRERVKQHVSFESIMYNCGFSATICWLSIQTST